MTEGPEGGQQTNVPPKYMPMRLVYEENKHQDRNNIVQVDTGLLSHKYKQICGTVIAEVKGHTHEKMILAKYV